MSTLIDEILNSMTLDEKIGQLTQLATPFFEGASDSGKITGPMQNIEIPESMIQKSGSVLGACGAAETNNIQKKYLSNNRLGIPLLFMADIVHGYKTIFPVPLGLACSWEPDLIKESASIAAKEAAASGVHVTFAPMVDLVRDPRWGRVMESTGEDSYLNKTLAKAQVNGFQGEDLVNETEKIAACVKHFAAYGAPEGGRDYNTVDISELELRENHLPAYRAAIEEGAHMVMTSFNTIFGVPATGNIKLLRDILRNEWEFKGVTISDWGAVNELLLHAVAENEAEAAQLALEAGTDIELMSSIYVQGLENLVHKNLISEGLIDEAVFRILQLKEKLNLFNNPYRGNPETEEKTILCKEHRQAALKAASKSCVLLKNDQHTLPLNKQQDIALIGPFANNDDILGPWSWLGSFEDTVNLYKGISSTINTDTNTLSITSTDIEKIDNKEVEQAVQNANKAEIIILALGEPSEWSGEAGSRTSIQLPPNQIKLLQELYKLNKPIVTILFNGRPLDLKEVIQYSDAVLEAWYPGTEGGNAIADILFGSQNPSGKLTMSFPYTVGQIPVYYNHYNTGRPQITNSKETRYLSQYLDAPNEPLFPFGFGLSYSNFSYYNMKLSAHVMHSHSVIEAEITIENTSKYSGEEIVQLYIKDHVGKVVRPVQQLINFKKIFLEAHETTNVKFLISEEELRYHHSDFSYHSDYGSFSVMIGPHSRDVSTQTFDFVY